MEQSGKLLRKVLKNFVHSPKVIDSMYFKDLFREAALRGLIPVESSERWLLYRDNRNNTAHVYGVTFAEEILKIVPQFIGDARELSFAIRKNNP